MKAMGYAQQVIESISYNTSNGVLSWIGKKSGGNSGSGSVNIKEIKVNSSGYADSAGSAAKATNDGDDNKISTTYAKKDDLNKYAGYSVLNVNSYKNESSGAIASVYPAGIWHKFSAVTIKPGVNFLGTSRAIGNFSILSGSGSWSSGSNAYALCINLGTTSYNRYYLTISASSSDFSAQYYIPFFAQGVPLEIQRLN